MAGMADQPPPVVDRFVKSVVKVALALVALRIALSLIEPVLPLLLVLSILVVIFAVLSRRSR